MISLLLATKIIITYTLTENWAYDHIVEKFDYCQQLHATVEPVKIRGVEGTKKIWVITAPSKRECRKNLIYLRGKGK